MFERNNNLDFIKEDGDTINAELSLPIIESVFYKNSPLHDGAAIVVGNVIVATRVTLPISKNRNINRGYYKKLFEYQFKESENLKKVIWN